MHIAFFEVQDWEKDYLKNQLSDADAVFFAEKLSVEFFDSTQNKNADLAKDVDVISVFVDSQVDKDILGRLPNLKMIATRSSLRDI